MLPTISQDDAVLAMKLDQSNVHNITTGDIIVYFHEGEKICHRVYEVYPGEGFHTKGDARSAPDTYMVKYEDIYAIALCIFPL